MDNELESIQQAFTEFQLDTKESLKRNQTKPQDIAVLLDGVPSKRAVKDRGELLVHHSDYLK